MRTAVIELEIGRIAGSPDRRIGYPARSRAAAAIVPAMDFDQQARYVGVNWARRRLGS
ncbi:hypothetical protein MKP05_18555 [Halomonas sp. EGI 63088]|uniref:Uncharacterized protein n=1 Tax=Halomonas flagellata TaxID=2920385 RepID=A0ABS9RZ30_9GAMM|nr:hypothetical protein [Halomonas flagellata]MCH4565102.1 hypothetical protein [Halomonas flagellata]